MTRFKMFKIGLIELKPMVAPEGGIFFLGECPICDNKEVKLIFEEVVRTYKGKSLLINEYFYKCDQCQYEFTTTEVDEINVQTTKEAYGTLLDQFIDFIRKQY